ncbi:MAG TPA: serine/threonine-protein kinase, partial [Candidatus Thermoplasmatota archaeon]|nr:serine/threonine-protein kinase [Candidatus Thermoplasmatota archaeon]
LPFTLLLVGLVMIAGAGGVGSLLVRRRLARLATDVGARGFVVAPGALVLGKYRVGRALGEGGSGRVFLAKDVRIGRSVVLKTLASGDHAAAVREARAAAGVEHPNVVRVYDVEGLATGALLVLEYVDGGSLKDFVAARGALPAEAFARVADGLLAALDAVHAAGAVHRDVKPGNVLLTLDGRAKLSDFGIARLPGFETTIGPAAAGTVQYMSPEQARGRRVTTASDLYSAAVTLYEARTGRALVGPLPEESAAEMQMRVGAPAAVEPDVEPAALRAWFARALAPDPTARFPDAAEMRAALAAALAT